MISGTQKFVWHFLHFRDVVKKDLQQLTIPSSESDTHYPKFVSTSWPRFAVASIPLKATFVLRRAGVHNFSLLPPAISLVLRVMAASDSMLFLWITFSNRIYTKISHSLVCSGGLRGWVTGLQPGAPIPKSIKKGVMRTIHNTLWKIPPSMGTDRWELCAHSLKLLRWCESSWYFGVWSGRQSLEN